MEPKAIKEEIIDKEYPGTTPQPDTSRRIKINNTNVNGKERTPDPEDLRRESPTSNPANGTTSPNGNPDSQSPPIQPGIEVTYQRSATTSPLCKLRKFLSALIQVSGELSPDATDRARALVHSVLGGAISLEEFQAGISESTNYPLKASVPGFLRTMIPHAQRELLTLARHAKQTPLQYLRTHEYLFLDSSTSGTPGDPSEIFMSTPNQLGSGVESTGVKRRIELLYDQPQTNGHPSSSEGGAEYTSKRPHMGSGYVNPTQLLYPLHPHHMFEYHPYQSYHSQESERRNAELNSFEQPKAFGLGKSDDEWKNINTMLNCILSMVEKTKRALAILQSRGVTPESSDSNDIKRVANEIMAATVRQTEERVAEVRRRAEDAVNQVKRQALQDLQRAVSTAETKALELVAAERTKMERLLDQARRQKNTPPPVNEDIPAGQQNSCWNCGRKAQETCSGCNVARYCGSFCQHKDWESHHQVCSATRDQKPQTTISPNTSSTKNTATVTTAQETRSDRANIVALNTAHNLISGVGGKR